jgi:hypothetical protein
VIGEDDELQSGARRRGRDRIDGAAAVGAIRMNVKRAAHHGCGRRVSAFRTGRQQREQDQREDGQDDRGNPESTRHQFRGWNLS